MNFFAKGFSQQVLLQNYSRLHLPHVRRRLEHRLNELSQQKDALLRDVQQVQRASRQTGMARRPSVSAVSATFRCFRSLFKDAFYMLLGPVEVQLRAHIFLQSVNVIRNMDYLARCIKTEVQRLATDKKARRAQLPKSLAASGLQLLCPDLAMRKPCF